MVDPNRSAANQALIAALGARPNGDFYVASAQRARARVRHVSCCAAVVLSSSSSSVDAAADRGGIRAAFILGAKLPLRGGGAAR